MKKSILKEFFGLSNIKTTTIGGKKFELGKVYSDPYTNAFKPQPQNEGSGIGPSFVYEDDDTEEYDVENYDDYENFISFLRVKEKEKDAYNEFK